MLGDEAYAEGTFFHYLSNEELSVQLGDGLLFLTYYSGLGKPRAKRVINLSATSREDIEDLLKDYRRA